MSEEEPTPGSHLAPGRILVDGRSVAFQPGQTVLQAWLVAEPTRTDVVGCAGQGVCGACRALVRRPDTEGLVPALACEVSAAPGVEVTFLDRQLPRYTHRYDLETLDGLASVREGLLVAFPEAQHCRHCHGCDAACPKGLSVEGAVLAAVRGDLDSAAAAFDLCVMCGLCTGACPEEIAPNHLGVFVRGARTVIAPLPDDLTDRLREIAEGDQPIVLDWGDR